MDMPDTAPPLRLWPGVFAAILLVMVRLIVPVLVPEMMPFAVMGAALCALAIVVWWAFFSRAPRSERRFGVILMLVALVATVPLLHVSLAKAGMGLMFVVMAIPGLALAFVIWAVASRNLSPPLQRATMVATVLIGCAPWLLARTDGVTSDLVGSDLHWRWTPTAEERLLASAAGAINSTSVVPPSTVSAPAPSATTTYPPAPAIVETAVGPDTGESGNERVESSSSLTIHWPGFRGPGRDSIVQRVQVVTDWAASPPVAIWRRPIGPGWSSFAVAGDVLYTQEQRGDAEIVGAYRVSTGEPVWMHRDAVRFWESNGGAGPRATPTLSGSRVYTFGATGILNALDARTGAAVWSRDVASDLSAGVPTWGFASSPLVVDDVVVVAAAGTLAGYDLKTGQRRWVGPDHGAGYSSPHLLNVDGVVQVLLVSEAGMTSVAPRDGTLLWEHDWSVWPMFPVVQPALASDADLVFSTSASGGTRRITVGRAAGRWTLTERWTSSGLKPNFNDFVVHNGHAYGFDGTILACIDLADGTRKWKGGRYGQGQLMLLKDQNVLLVVSEDGEIALVGATTDQYRELARVPAIEGKTWNHPALVGDVLLVRNGEEMAAFRLPLANLTGH